MKHTIKEAAEVLRKYDLPDVTIDGPALNELRESVGISQKKAAELMCMSQPSVSRIKKTKRLRRGTINKWLAAIDVTEADAKLVLSAASSSHTSLTELLESDDVASRLEASYTKMNRIKQAILMKLASADIETLRAFYEYMKLYEAYHNHRGETE